MDNVDFYLYVAYNFDDSYFEVLTSNTTIFRELIKGNYYYVQHSK